MQPPTVRTLDQLTAESNPIYDQQRQNVQQQITAAGSRLNTATTGLDAAKTNAFGDITSAAARRGALFGGFSQDQQARYTAEKYLPALAELYSNNEKTVQGLNTDLVNINTDQFKTAKADQTNDQGRLDKFNSDAADRQFQTDQANIAYQREMEKLKADQAFTANQNALNRSAQAALQASANKSSKPTTDQFLVSAFSGYDPKKAAGFTEKEVIPSLMANYGLSQAQAASLAYSYRKRVYKE